MKLLALALVVVWPLAVPSPVFAGCGEKVDLLIVEEECHSSAEDIEEEKELYPTAKWAAIRICKNDKVDTDGRCLNPEICVTESGLSGTLHTITRDDVEVGTACLTDEEAVQVALPPMRALATAEFKRLKWPASPVNAEPRGGKTLVNLETIFYTVNNRPSTKTVTLASKQVEIVATPVAYTWSFGDGETLTTEAAGRPHPARDITHVYTSTDSVTASVVTTYKGRYRVEGKRWKDIDETLAVAGPATSLEVLEAKPQLVLR